MQSVDTRRDVLADEGEPEVDLVGYVCHGRHDEFLEACACVRAFGPGQLVRCSLQTEYVLAYMICTSSGTLATTSVCSCSQLQDLASQNTAKRMASIAAWILRLWEGGRGIVVLAGACSCVCGSKGVFGCIAVFSESGESMAKLCASVAANSPAVA